MDGSTLVTASSRPSGDQAAGPASTPSTSRLREPPSCQVHDRDAAGLLDGELRAVGGEGGRGGRAVELQDLGGVVGEVEQGDLAGDPPAGVGARRLVGHQARQRRHRRRTTPTARRCVPRAARTTSSPRWSGRRRPRRAARCRGRRPPPGCRRARAASAPGRPGSRSRPAPRRRPRGGSRRHRRRARPPAGSRGTRRRSRAATARRPAPAVRTTPTRSGASSPPSPPAPRASARGPGCRPAR